MIAGTNLGDTDDHVVERTSDSTQARNVLTASLPYGERDKLLALDELGVQLDVHVDMSEVLLECTAGTGDGDKSGLDRHGNVVRYGEIFGRENVAHLQVMK